MQEDITFESRYEPSDDWDDSDCEISPYVSLAYPAEDIAGQRYPEEIVIKLKTIRVKYDYPLSHEVILSFDADRPEGFTRAHLARKISEGYQQIYREEEEAVGNPGHIPGMANRNRSNGPHGIWGHDLGDLLLHSVSHEGGDLFSLGVDS